MSVNVHIPIVISISAVGRPHSCCLTVGVFILLAAFYMAADLDKALAAHNF
jgi:hypothetical protein